MQTLLEGQHLVLTNKNPGVQPFRPVMVAKKDIPMADILTVLDSSQDFYAIEDALVALGLQVEARYTVVSTEAPA